MSCTLTEEKADVTLGYITKSIASMLREVTLSLLSALAGHIQSTVSRSGLPSTRRHGLSGVTPVKSHKND